MGEALKEEGEEEMEEGEREKAVGRKRGRRSNRPGCRGSSSPLQQWVLGLSLPLRCSFGLDTWVKNLSVWVFCLVCF